jgi:hypothetical protein
MTAQSPRPAGEPRRLVVDVTIAAPVDAVWRALREPAQLAQWFGWDYEKLAEEIDVIFVAGGVETEPGRVLNLGGDAFELIPEGTSTRVRLVRSDPPAGDTWDGVYDDVDEGWRTFVAQLAFWLEVQNGVARDVSARRTLYVAGHRETADAPTLTAAAGLSALDGLAVGERYALTAATGETLAGRVRFRSEHQLGVSVDAWGPGFLVFAGKTPGDKSPHGGGFALITTFGLDTEALGRLEAAWAAAWRAAFTRVTVMR